MPATTVITAFLEVHRVVHQPNRVRIYAIAVQAML
jgi:hypothetical protein